jgi:hypothetical protein
LLLAAVLCSGCTQGEKEEFFRALAAVAIVAMLGVLFVAAMALLLLLLSLISLALNLAKPSMVSVVGGLVFAGLFFLSGVTVGGAVILNALHTAASTQVVLEGIGWIFAHTVYAGGLAASSAYGYRKVKRAKG